MKKLVFSIQVFIVTLLAAQLTSCEGFPGPEPISEQYARPEQVIVPGVPVVKGDGKSIYQPTSSRDFRYAAAMIANSNGTMSACFSTPGGTTGSLPAATSLNGSGAGGGPYPMHSNGNSGAIKYTFDKSFYGWIVDCPGWSTNTSCFHWELYQWNNDYISTVSGTPIAQYDHMNYADNSSLEINTDNSGYADETGNVKFPAGTYLLYMERISGTPGCWGAGIGENMTVWHNGTELSGTQAFRTKAQYTSPADVGYSAQIRYYTASSVTNDLTWSEDNIVAVAPTNKKADSYYAKDPAVVKAGDYYYMVYTGSTTVVETTDNELFVARSATPDGKNWEKWNGTGWGGDPAAIVSANLTAEETFFGVGEASLIVKDGQIYLYYTYNDQAIDVYDIHLATASASDPNWPAALSDKGKVIDRNKFAANSVSGCDVKYVDELNCFQAIHGVNVNEVNTYLAIWQSTDGITGWEQIGIVTDNTRVRLKYPRVVGNDQGHVTSAVHLLTYQYGISRSSWRTWMSSYQYAE